MSGSFFGLGFCLFVCFGVFVCFFICLFGFETKFLCVVLVVLELSLWTRLASTSEIHLPLPLPPVLGLMVYATILARLSVNEYSFNLQ